MTKPTITRIFIGSIIAVVAGLLLGLAAIIAAYDGGAFVMDGPDVVGFSGGAFAWSMIGLAILGALAAVGGSIAGLVAWIGALLNTAQLADKTWFILLLVLGLFSFGVIAMIAYVIGGPDGTQPADARSGQSFDVGGVHV